MDILIWIKNTGWGKLFLVVLGLFVGFILSRGWVMTSDEDNESVQNEESRAVGHDYRPATMSTQCYPIPYNYSQIKEIEEENGLEEEIMRELLLREINESNEDPKNILTPPSAIFYQNYTLVCMDFSGNTAEKPELPSTHIL